MTRQTIIKTQGIISPEGIGPKGLAPPPFIHIHYLEALTPIPFFCFENLFM